MATSRQRIIPYLALVVGVLGLSLSALFIRWSTAAGVVTTFYRMGLAGLFLTPFYLRQPAKNRVPRALLLVPILGGVCAALDHATWSTAIGLTRVANATLLNNTAPIWVCLVAWFIFHERLKRFFWAGLALTMGGAVIVLGSDAIKQPTLSWGDLIALASGLFYAAYYLVTQRGRRSLNALSYIWVADLTSCLILLVISLAFRLPLSGFPPATYLSFLGAALFSQVAGHSSLSYALGHLPASVVAPTMIAQPVLTALLAIPLLGEALQPSQWIGGICVLAGIYIVNRSQ